VLHDPEETYVKRRKAVPGPAYIRQKTLQRQETGNQNSSGNGADGRLILIVRATDACNETNKRKIK